jgi:hypothetical protein
MASLDICMGFGEQNDPNSRTEEDSGLQGRFFLLLRQIDSAAPCRLARHPISFSAGRLLFDG